ncbi:MAG: hypothetical protein KF754_12880 [Planctomycetes bacterium]|nr:hypothetical protein [Planctomycetota bacterium]
MESPNRATRAVLWLALVLALCAAVPLHAQEQFKQLRRDISELTSKLNEAESALSEANRKISENQKAQDDAKNDPARLNALKTEGTRLRAAADTAQDNRNSARARLASKQGEMRGTASKHAADQVTGAGNLNVRVNEIRIAIDAWNEALGALPVLPALRNTAGLDPDTKRATLAGDKARLTDLDNWAAAEESRLKTELERADSLINFEPQVKGLDDGPVMVESSKQLKKTLQERQKKVGELRNQAAELMKKLG